MNIKRIISVELLKLPVVGNYIILGILLLLDIAFSFLFFYEFSASSSADASFIEIGRQVLTYQSSFGALLISIFVILNVGGEYKNGTLSKNIIDGYSREDFYVGKFFVMLFCVLFALVVGILSLTIGSLVLGKWDDFMLLMDAPFVINFFFKLFYSGLFALFLIFLFKKVAISLVLYFVWEFIESIAVGLHSAYIHSKGINPTFKINEFLPSSSVNIVLNATEYVETYSIIVTGIYILLFLLLPYFLFLKSDIKS
jgi:hypothetical protein